MVLGIVGQGIAKGATKLGLGKVIGGLRKSGSDITPSTSRELALYDPSILKKSKLQKAGTLAKKGGKYGLMGAGAYSLYDTFLGGQPTPAASEVLPADYTPWSPQQAINDQYAQAVAIISGQTPNQQDVYDRLAQFQQMTGSLGGVGGGGAAGTNVYAQQAQQILDEAGAGSGSATSSLSAVGGPVTAMTDNMIAQGGTLDDYIKMMESSAARAGVRMTADMKAKLYTDAMNTFNARNNAIQQSLQELALQRVASQQAASQYPDFIVDDVVIKSAQALQKAGGNKAPLNYYIDRLAKDYYRGLASQG